MCPMTDTHEALTQAMRCLSIDPSGLNSAGAKVGVARWQGARLVDAFTLRPIGQSGTWRRWRNGKAEKASTAQARHVAFGDLVRACDHVAIEAAHVLRFPAATIALARTIGYVEALCDRHGAKLHVVTPAEWRRVAKDCYGGAWPTGGEAAKQRAIDLVRARFGFLADEHSAEAVLVGVWLHAAILGHAP
jgi:hypothetical protein